MAKKQKADTAPDPSSEMIRTCARLVGLLLELRILVKADEYAPDKGPLKALYDELQRRRDVLHDRIRALGSPRTTGATYAMAEVAFAEAERDNHGTIIAAATDDWLALSVVQGITGRDVPMMTGQEELARNLAESVT